MANAFAESIRLDSFLSFAPSTDAFALQPLNVLIGPNGSGKSNVIEAFELLRATPTNFSAAVRDGGGASEWIWKGDGQQRAATVELITGPEQGPSRRPLRYRLEFGSIQQRVEVLDEAVEEAYRVNSNHNDVFFYYRFQRGRPAINVRSASGSKARERYIERSSILPDQSVLAQRKDPDLYPELTWLGQQFGAIQIFREWSFGRYTVLRQPQPADLPDDTLLPDARNLGLVLNQIEHRDSTQLNCYLRRFLPRFERISTRVSGGTVQFYLHEQGLKAPIPPTRLSDGTIRFLAILATLLAPAPPSLLCIEEPELGLHPDSLSLVAELLVEASARMQIIVTTHSDVLVSALTDHAASLVICERHGPGTSLSRVDPERLHFWLDRYRLGEIWRIGELGANP